MSPRLQRLATDWKTYASLVSAVGAWLSGATGLVNKVAQAFGAVASLPSEAKWLAAGLLATLSVLALVAVLGRRSILLRPERFVISPDDPEHLVGRDEEVKALAKACEENALVFLQGESGAGKSALVLGGLLPQYTRVRTEPRLLPIRIDTSPLAWHKGLRIELARALRAVSADEQARLGAALGSGDPFSWLETLPVDATCQVLLVLDQIDDYAVAHQARFVRGHTVVAPEQFEEANADWAAIGSLVRKGSIRLLIVCRADAAGILDALRFTRATTFLLPRIDQHLLSPILDRVTQADEGGPVVADPEHGWLQLKAKLLRNLAADGTQILPVQLAVGLDSVRRFRFLTPSEYARNGGVRGLERLHIERHLHDAARGPGAAGLTPDALLRGLLCLVAENGLKTKRATLSEFAQAIGVAGAGAAALETVVDHLVRWRILRRQSDAEGEYLLLHHDYLARGVREVYRQANYWVELLRERTREFEEAFGWHQRWRALLPLVGQLRLWWARLRGRFRYGEHRPLALWSTLRLLPVAAALALAVGAGWWVDRVNQQQLAERALAGVSSNSDPSEAEALEWRQLASARWPARFHAVHIALSKPSIAPKASARADLLAHAAVGLDPTGELSRQLFRGAILSVLDQGDPNSCAASLTVALRLRLATLEVGALARSVVKQIETEQDLDALLSLGEAPAWLSRKLEAKYAQPLAAALVKRMETEQNSEVLSSLGEALAGLSRKLEAKDVQPLAALLVKRMGTEQDSHALSSLAVALAGLSGKLEAKDVKSGVAALVKRMETDSDPFSSLGAALTGLSGKLEGKDAQPIAAMLAKRMETEQDSEVLSRLGEVLAELTGKLEAKDVQPGAAALAKRMETEQSSDALSRLGEALAKLSGKLEGKDVQSGVAALVKRMETEPAALAKWIRTLPATVVDSMRRLWDQQLALPFRKLGEALAKLSGKLEAKDVQPLAAPLVERMGTEQDSDALSSLAVALAGLSGKLEAKDVQPGAAALVQRMKTEQSSDALSRLGEALAKLSGKLEAKDVQPGVAALVQRMKTEQSSDALSRLGEALAKLSGKLEGKDAQPIAAVLAKRMETEQEFEVLSNLGEALTRLSGKLDAKRLAAALVKRMETEQDSEVLSSLGEALTKLSKKLEAKEVQPLASALEEAMRIRNNVNDIPTLAESWVTLERIAYDRLDDQKRVQTYVDLLRLPLVVGDARKALLHGLDHITGEKFEGDLWRFVAWATESDRGKMLQLDLGGP